MHNPHFENLKNNFKIYVSDEHKFGTDSFLISNYANIHRGEKCCDIGSGCGIIPLLWFANGNNPSCAYAVEIQKDGYDQMLVTIKENNIEDRFFPLYGDANDMIEKIGKASLDCITCNPPYKIEGRGIPCPTDARLTARHEGTLTLDSLSYIAGKLLRYGGRLCLCQRPERLPDIFEAMRKNRIEPKRIRFVQKHGNTAPWLVLCEGRMGGKPFLQVEAPLIVYKEDGTFTDEMQKIYGFM